MTLWMGTAATALVSVFGSLQAVLRKSRLDKATSNNISWGEPSEGFYNRLESGVS